MEADCTLSQMGWYYPDLIAQNGTINFAMLNDPTDIANARASVPPVKVLYDTSAAAIDTSAQPWKFMPNWQAVLQQLWASTIQPLVAQGVVVGFFLGDELVDHGLPFNDLKTYAEFLRDIMSNAIIYTNEGTGTR